ncbi:hypothetical protein [Moorena sp. SIO4G3]|uniref:hypothetical protein n=1 Tax=Moorena sp. SIO4G3 TaxID=2607821 RepID=UPI001429F1B0|nr:hypothetical protein [Moorena sp. SIO4G3]NEO82529.1 hypothetical protein [Moorena sp. SIO4G3]
MRYTLFFPSSLLPAPCSLLPAPCSLLPAPCSRLDAVAHGGNPQDRAASLLPKNQKFVPHKS